MRNSIKKLGLSAVVMGLLASSTTFVQAAPDAEMKTQPIKAAITVAASTVDLKDIKHIEFTANDEGSEATMIRYDEASKKWMISTDQGKTWKESEGVVSMTKIIESGDMTHSIEAVKLTEAKKGTSSDSNADAGKTTETTVALKLVPSQEASK